MKDGRTRKSENKAGNIQCAFSWAQITTFVPTEFYFPHRLFDVARDGRNTLNKPDFFRREWNSVTPGYIKNMGKIGFLRNQEEEESAPETKGTLLTPEETHQQLTELINRLWCPADGFASADVFFTNAQVEEILVNSSSCAFSLHEMVIALQQSNFHQKAAGNDLFWLLRKKQ